MDFSALDSVVQQGIDHKEYPGAVLMIGKGDDVLYQKAYGRYTFEPDAKPMTMDTLFDMASVSKVVGTASTAMALVEEGRLNLNDLVSKYIDGFSTGGMEKGISTVVRHAAPDFEHVVLCLGRSGESVRLLPAGTRVLELGKRPGHSAVFLLRLARDGEPQSLADTM